MIKQPPMTAIAQTAKILTVTIEKLETAFHDTFYLVTENIVFSHKNDAKQFKKNMDNFKKTKVKNEPLSVMMEFNYIRGGKFYIVKEFTVFRSETKAKRYKEICQAMDRDSR